jgi:hypothetical protein
LWATLMGLWLHSLSCYLWLLLWRLLCNFIDLCRFSFHLFIGFMHSIGLLEFWSVDFPSIYFLGLHVQLFYWNFSQ